MSSFQERFSEWEREPPADLLGDPIWRLPAYRIALFMSRIAQEDAVVLIRDRAPPHVYSQLERSADSIRANISEGYSRLSGKERARFFEIALGSAREAKDWYRGLESWLGIQAVQERAALLTRAIKILTVAIPRERAGESERRLNRKRQLPTGSPPAPAPAPVQQPAPVRASSNQQPAKPNPPGSSSSPSQTDR